jgi:uncharacterized protein (TIGR02246 family)
MEFTEKDAAAVTHAVSENNRLIGFNDLEGVLAYHAEDSRFLPPEGPPVEGKAAIREFMKKWPVYKKSEASDIRVEGREDLAVATCAVSIVHETPKGGEYALSAKQMHIVKKQADGRWLISALIFNAEPQPV